jgi:hypothetical protein
MPRPTAPAYFGIIRRDDDAFFRDSALEQGKQRPLYLIAETRGFPDDPDTPGPVVPANRASAGPA